MVPPAGPSAARAGGAALAALETVTFSGGALDVDLGAPPVFDLGGGVGDVRSAQAGHHAGDRDDDQDAAYHVVVAGSPLLAPGWGGAGRGTRARRHAKR